MTIKTTLKRVALATVAALGVGLLTSVAPATAQINTAIAAYVGPNGQTSLTVVGNANQAPSALVRVDVTSNDSSTVGLALNESITVTVSGVPTSVTAKTLAANGGSVSDSGTVWNGTNGKSDLAVFNVGAGSAQTSGTGASTSANVVSGVTNWTRMGSAYYDSATPTLSYAPGTDTAAINAGITRGVIGSLNTFYTRMDNNRATTTAGNNVASYYVAVAPRTSATVIDQGAYTLKFELTDANGVVRGSSTVKIDFVSAASKADGVITLGTTGTFIKSAQLYPYDSATSDAYATLTLKNRDNGVIRNYGGGAVVPSATIQWIRTGFLTSDTITLTVNDSGTYGADFGTQTAYTGAGTIKGFDGVYGLTASALPTLVSATGNTYQIWAGYGNATIVTKALTIYEASGSGSASAARTDALLTADGMKATDQLLKSNATSQTWTVPATTKSASLRVYIQNSSDTATPAALITVTPTWSGAHGSASVTPATSTTGTVYTTDANGVIDVSITNAAPVAGASLSLVFSGAEALGTGTFTATIDWAAPVATSIAIADPITGVHVKTGSTNVTTVIVKDQFEAPVANQSVTVTLAVTPAPTVASTTVIAPLTTDANGTATYSNTGGAAITKDTLSFQCAPTACGTAASMVYNYVATVPVVGTMTAYHGYNHQTAGATLTPSTGIYQSGTSTELVLRTNRNISKSLTSFSDSASDDMLNLRFYGLTAAGLAAEGAVVTVTAGAGGHILDAAGLPVSTRNFLIGATGYTQGIQVLATKTGAITFTATSGAVTATASMWVANATADARFVTITSAATGTANSTGVPVTVSVTDRYGNAVSGVALNVTASGVGSFMGGGITTSFTTDASGVYTFLANSLVAEGGVGTFTVSSGTTSDMSSAAGYVGATAVDSTLAKGNSTASASIKFAAGISSAVAAGNAATAAAEAATDAAAEAIDAANAATDAANLAAEAADAATVAAEEARDAADAATAAVEELATQVATLMAALKAQITTLANTVAKIAKKVKA